KACPTPSVKLARYDLPYGFEGPLDAKRHNEHIRGPVSREVAINFAEALEQPVGGSGESFFDSEGVVRAKQLERVKVSVGVLIDILENVEEIAALNGHAGSPTL